MLVGLGLGLKSQQAACDRDYGGVRAGRLVMGVACARNCLMRLKQRSITLRRLYMSWAKTDDRPRQLPRRARVATWL